MKGGRHLFTSESVTEGHPDKICDQISDAVLDAIFKDDPQARVACECFTKTGVVIVGGEITTNTYVNINDIVRKTLKDIGYTKAAYGIEHETCAVLAHIEEQSPEIAAGVDERSVEGKEGSEQGAGDQGMMFGYATTETKELMPLPIMLAHKLVKRLSDCRKQGILSYLRPDCKSQVTVEYSDGKPNRVTAVVIAAQHIQKVDEERVSEDVIDQVIKKVIPSSMLTADTKYIINGTGRFVIGGTLADSGLTGRKIIVDTYGGFGSHGGGCFSGKDPSKVDRSGCYMARYIAKNIVAAGLADECEVQLSYAIGVAHPISVFVNTFGTGKLPNEEILELVKKHFDMRPKAIIEHSRLIRPIYRKAAVFGHFGRNDPDFTWEKIDKAEELRKSLKSDTEK